jgi:hypothetical protein
VILLIILVIFIYTISLCTQVLLRRISLLLPVLLRGGLDLVNELLLLIVILHLVFIKHRLKLILPLRRLIGPIAMISLTHLHLLLLLLLLDLHRVTSLFVLLLLLLKLLDLLLFRLLLEVRLLV